jgi:hypothetical protein
MMQGGDDDIDNFMSRALSAIEMMALGHVHVPDDVAEQPPARIGANLHRDGASCYRRRLLPDDGLAEVVEDVLSRVRTRRQEIEAAGVGSA